MLFGKSEIGFTLGPVQYRFFCFCVMSVNPPWPSAYIFLEIYTAFLYVSSVNGAL